MPRQEFILGTAGHIDHGKTALIRTMTGIDTDRLEQEKKRGISIDIGFAHLEVGPYRLGIVDVPGHERFIKNMLAGASGIDLAMMLVAADDSVMPQTREHLAILELLRVPTGLVVITKTDLVEPDWLDLVEQDVRELVAGTFLEHAPIVRASAITGDGVEQVKQAIEQVCQTIQPDDGREPFRLAIDRSFMLQGLGTVVTGTVSSGVVAVDDELEWLPLDKKVRVRRIQTHGAEVESIGRGQRAALNLANVHHTEVARGHTLAAPRFLSSSRLLTVQFSVLPDSPWPIKHRARLRLYIGTQETMVQVRLLKGTLLQGGESALAQLECSEPVAAVFRQPFVLRSESPLRTIGGGNIVQPAAKRIARQDDAAKRRLADLIDGDGLTRAATAAYFNRAEPFGALDLARDAGLNLDRAQEALEELRTGGMLLTLKAGQRNTVHLHKDYFSELRNLVVKALRQLHVVSPLESAIARTSVVRRLNYLEANLVHGLIDRLIEEGELVGSERDVRLAEFSPTLSESQQQLLQRAVEAYHKGAFSPPEPGELAASLGVATDELLPLIDLAAAQGQLAHVGGGLFIHHDRELELRDRISKSLSNGPMTMGQIKEMLSTTRKFAVPLCEYLDRIGFTRRNGDMRVLTASSQAAASNTARQ